jgi:hypothetical protein
MSSKTTILAVRAALSAARMGTYEAEKGVTSDDDPSALELYAWNAQVSAALMAPLHICEVVVRNSIADALTTKYGSSWPWTPAFELSLPNPAVGYSPRRDLISVRSKHHTTGKVIPELKFAFWQRMFTQRFDGRLWNTQLKTVMPNLNPAKSVSQLRQEIYDDLEEIRRLRNRIAHHEPIFSRNLVADLQKIESLVTFRCSTTAGWMSANQQAGALIAACP